MPNASKTNVIKAIYFYAVSLVTLVMVMFSAANLINLGLKATIFTKADRVYEPQCLPELVPGAPQAERERLLRDCETQKRNVIEERQAQRERDLVRDIGILAVAVPVFAWHYGTARRESRLEREREEILKKKEQT